jgi:hypothetical protein
MQGSFLRMARRLHDSHIYIYIYIYIYMPGYCVKFVMCFVCKGTKFSITVSPSTMTSDASHKNIIDPLARSCGEW